MIKIPLKFINDQITLGALIDLPNHRIRYKRILFILDTGSQKSFLSEGDALRVNFPFSSLSNPELIRMGGAKYNLFPIKPVSIIFKTDQDKSHKIELGDFSIARSTKRTEDAKIESEN